MKFPYHHKKFHKLVNIVEDKGIDVGTTTTIQHSEENSHNYGIESVFIGYCWHIFKDMVCRSWVWEDISCE